MDALQKQNQTSHLVYNLRRHRHITFIQKCDELKIS